MLPRVCFGREFCNYFMGTNCALYRLLAVLIQAAPTGINAPTINSKTSLSTPFLIIIQRLECPLSFFRSITNNQRQPPTELTMTEFLIPVPLDGIYWRDKLFSLDKNITMPAKKFDEVWPLVKEIYSHRKTESKQNGDFTVSRWECRLLKSGRQVQ